MKNSRHWLHLEVEKDMKGLGIQCLKTMAPKRMVQILEKKKIELEKESDKLEEIIVSNCLSFAISTSLKK